VDLAAQAIRLTRLRESAEPEVAGLLALMLLHHARRDARRDRDGARVTLDEQDRSRGHTDEIAEGVRILTAALAQERPGEYQVQAAIAALHEDAATAAETDWVQILAWYDDLLALTGNPLVALNRAVAVGRSTGRRPGCGRSTGSTRPWVSTTGSTPCAHLLERAGRHDEARTSYLRAARRTTSTAERDHLTKKAALVRSRPEVR
jgi:predicted RNA polymerase sigma factor